MHYRKAHKTHFEREDPSAISLLNVQYTKWKVIKTRYFQRVSLMLLDKFDVLYVGTYVFFLTKLKRIKRKRYKDYIWIILVTHRSFQYSLKPKIFRHNFYCSSYWAILHCLSNVNVVSHIDSFRDSRWEYCQRILYLVVMIL